MESNHRLQMQSLPCCRYTTPQCLSKEQTQEFITKIKQHNDNTKNGISLKTRTEEQNLFKPFNENFSLFIGHRLIIRTDDFNRKNTLLQKPPLMRRGCRGTPPHKLFQRYTMLTQDIRIAQLQTCYIRVTRAKLR